MAPLQQWGNGLLVGNAASAQLVKRYEDPNDQHCHGWSCYTSAEQAGIIFMSIIVPFVLFMVFWFAIMRPILDNRSLSDYGDGGFEPVQPPPPPPEQPVHTPPQGSLPQAPIQDHAPREAAAPPPEQPSEPPPLPPQPEPSSPPPKEKTPEQSPLKPPSAVAAGSVPVPAPAVQSPTVVLNFNAPMGNPFMPPSAASAPPEKQQQVPKPAEETAEKSPKQQEQQPAEQPAERAAEGPAGEQPGEPAEQKFEQQSAHQPPFPQPPPVSTQMPFAPNQSFPPGQPFPPGIPYQPPQHPTYAPAPQFMPFIPPPPPPLHGQPAPAGCAAGNRPFAGPPGLNLASQIPQITTTFCPPVAPPGFQVNLTQMANPAFRGQPDTPTTFETSCSTALSRTRHPPLGRARTISDPRSHRSSSDNSRPSSLSEITLPSETSLGITKVPKKGRKQEYRRAGRKETTKPRRADAYARHDTLRRPKDIYRRHSEGRYRRDVKDATVRRVRPVRRDTSRSRSRSRSRNPDNRRSRYSEYSQPIEDKKPSRLRFLAPLIPIALGALGVVAEAEAKKHRDRAQNEAHPQTAYNPNRRSGEYRQKENRRPIRSHEADTRRRDRDTQTRVSQQRKRMVLEHPKRNHSSSAEGDDGSSGSTAFWRFRDSGSFRREQV